MAVSNALKSAPLVKSLKAKCIFGKSFVAMNETDCSAAVW